jgi:hypothetical protein
MHYGFVEYRVIDLPRGIDHPHEQSERRSEITEKRLNDAVAEGWRVHAQLHGGEMLMSRDGSTRPFVDRTFIEVRLPRAPNRLEFELIAEAMLSVRVGDLERLQMRLGATTPVPGNPDVYFTISWPGGSTPGQEGWELKPPADSGDAA